MLSKDGQNFTDERFFKGRVSSVNYNTYTEEDLIPDEEGNVAYGGVSSGSYNYGASNPNSFVKYPSPAPNGFGESIIIKS